MEFLTGLLASIIRPIIQKEIADLKDYIAKLYQRNEKWNEYDKELEKYLPALAGASTSEERWALLADLKSRRPRLDS